VGIILQAMGADFYPRLVGVATNDDECNRVVNEQAHVSLLLAGPGVLATLTFAPLVVSLFYSAKFAEAVEVLRWICLGIALRVITWPMGYIIVAKNKHALFLGVDVAWAIVNIGLTWICVRAFGLAGAGIAFFGSYVFHALMIYPIVRGLSGFRFAARTARTGVLTVCSIALAFLGFTLLQPMVALGVGIAATLLSCAYSIRVLTSLVSRERIPKSILRMLQLGGLAR
jgi:PST family polysaccharide transporter